MTSPSQWGGRDILAGRAFLSSNRGRVTTVFRYDSGYLASKGAFPLDPALPLFKGSHAIQDGLPFAFADSAPDRWGRNLIRKRLQSLAPDGARREVTDIDYLLEVSDTTRQGALRFTVASENSDEKFLAGHADVPKLIELPRLLAACDRFVGDGDLAAIKELLDAGAGSLGGARPKASVRDGGRLLIAKLSSLRDEWDVIAWEKTALDLAERACITVPGRRLERIAGRSVLLLDRFDRTPDGARIRYLSAMSPSTTRMTTYATTGFFGLIENAHLIWPHLGAVVVSASAAIYFKGVSAGTAERMDPRAPASWLLTTSTPMVNSVKQAILRTRTCCGPRVDQARDSSVSL